MPDNREIITKYTADNLENEFKFGGGFSTYSLWPPFLRPVSVLGDFPRTCYKLTSLSSASDRGLTWNHGKSEIKGRFYKNDERSKSGNFRGSSLMYKDSSFWKSSWWLLLYRNYGGKGSGRSMGLGSGFVKRAKSRWCLRRFLVISDKI